MSALEVPPVEPEAEDAEAPEIEFDALYAEYAELPFDDLKLHFLAAKQALLARCASETPVTESAPVLKLFPKVAQVDVPEEE